MGRVHGMDGEITLKTDIKMEQEITWTHCFGRMSRRILFLMVWLVCGSCFFGSNELYTSLRIKFTYLNDTDHEVIIESGRVNCGFDEENSKAEVLFPIPSHDTLVLHVTYVEYQGKRPTVDNMTLYHGGCGGYIKIDSIFHCFGYSNFGDVLTYEDRKELPDNMFEFTYRFTQQKIDEEFDLCQR